MARWLVQVDGERMDLEELPRWFPDGDVFAIEERGTFYFIGPFLETLPNADAVRTEATRRLDELSAVISLLWSGFKKPVVSRVLREDDQGKRDVFVLLSASVSMRAKAGAVFATGGMPGPSQPTQAQQLLARARAQPHLAQALSIWAEPTRSWPRLYRIMEEIEQHLGQPVDAAGLCSGQDRRRFRTTANTAEVSGVDSRHASGKFAPPSDPMDLHEATSFIGRLLSNALK